MREIVERGDLDELTRFVDRLCDSRDWEGLLELRDRCRRALERGKQLWPIASNAEYRLALDAPGTLAAQVLVEGTGHLALGPLAEVAASNHTWADLAPHVLPGPIAGLAAHERVVRGEDLSGMHVEFSEVLGVPLRLQRWEPAYAVPVYRSDRIELTGPIAPRGRVLHLPETQPAPLAEDDGVRALRDVTRAWATGSEAQVRVVAVVGDAAAAVRALGVEKARSAWLDATEALAFLAWAGASGGVHGRRRGCAPGRDAAWVAAAALAGFDTDEPVEPDELGEAIADLRWCWWSSGADVSGWVLRLAVEDPAEHLAWAIDATDSVSPPVAPGAADGDTGDSG